MTTNRKYRGLKIAGIILLVLLAIGGGILFYFSQHYKNILRAKLPVISAKATDSLYKVTANDYSINIFTKSFSIHGLHIRPDSIVLERLRKAGKGPHVLLDILIPEVEITGLKWKEVAVDKEVVCAQVDVYRPKINITVTNDNPPKDSLTKPEPAINRILARNIMIKDPEINYKYGYGDNAYSIKAKGGRITAVDWDFYPRESSDSLRFFYAHSADVQLNKIVYTKPGSLYTFGVDTLHFFSEQHRLDLSDVYVKPTVSKEEFYRSVAKQKEIYEGTFPHVRVNDFQWEPFITRQIIIAQSIDLTNPDLEIYLSRLQPANTESKVGNYPQELLQKISLPLNIPEIKLQGGSFRYKEQNEKTHRVGTLDFGNINGAITNVTNIQDVMDDDPHCMIKLKGKFMRRSDMAVTFDLLLPSKTGHFAVSGQLGELDAKQITDAAKALALAEIKSLKLHKLSFSIKGNDTVADGKITIEYNDLRVKLQKVDEATKEMRSRGFLSLLANELLLYNDNPMDGEELRVATTHVSRDPTKSFFNLIWRNLFNAGLQTAIRQEGATDLVKKRQANKGKEKVHFFRQLFPKRNKNKDTTGDKH